MEIKAHYQYMTDAIPNMKQTDFNSEMWFNQFLETEGILEEDIIAELNCFPELNGA